MAVSVRMISILCLLAGLGAQDSQAQSNPDCSDLLHGNRDPSLPASGSLPLAAQSLDELLGLFSRGLIPDLSQPNQRIAFDLYLKIRFGNPNAFLGADPLGRVAEELARHPDLHKEPFRNFIVEQKAFRYGVTDRLAKFTLSHLNSSGQVRSNLFRVGENLGYWKQVFSYPGSESEKYGIRMEEFLESRIPSSLRSALRNAATPAKERAKTLFSHLREQRRQMQKNGESVQRISQTMVDLIHTIGYHDQSVIDALKSADAQTRIGAFRQVLVLRDEFAMELGFRDHFAGALNQLGVAMPTGVESEANLPETIQSLYDEAAAQKNRTESTLRFEVRHLSLIESLFRSCVGGSDCSTRTYLTRALDPNYHYFTMTDEQGRSTGQATVVLGSARAGETPLQTAFLDKVQNVDPAVLPVFLEAIRQSLLEKNLRLAIPMDPGNHNGISNDASTRNFIANRIPVAMEPVLLRFKPRPHRYRFENTYSRADQALPMRMVLSAPVPETTRILPGEIITDWKTPEIPIQSAIASLVALKRGGPEEQFRYLSSIRALRKAGQVGDPLFEPTLREWIRNPALPFLIRKEALLIDCEDHVRSLPEALIAFSQKEQVDLIQNILDTPRRRHLITERMPVTPDLIVRVRFVPKVRTMLTELYPESIRELITRIAETGDLNAEQVKSSIRYLEKCLNHGDFSSYAGVLRNAANSGIREWIEDRLGGLFLNDVLSNDALARRLNALREEEEPGIRGFRDAVFARVFSEERFQGFPVRETHQEILTLARRSGAGLEEAAWEWLRDPAIETTRKSAFVLSQIGADLPRFDRARRAVPPDLQEELGRAIEDQSAIGVFRAFAEQKNLSPFLFREGVEESFRFVSDGFPNGTPGGAILFRMGEGDSARMVNLSAPFEMQATPVTQLQWMIVMGRNPSITGVNAKSVNIDGRQVSLDPDHPVLRVSWFDAMEFVSRLNSAQEQYVYRLPTSAEWEFGARAGSRSRFFFGDNPKEMDQYGWTASNSEFMVHPVARLRPNRFGLYDVHGNIQEWTADLVRSTGKSSEFRVVRGGSNHLTVEYARCAYVSGFDPKTINSDLGFRLVREPRKPNPH